MHNSILEVVVTENHAENDVPNFPTFRWTLGLWLEIIGSILDSHAFTIKTEVTYVRKADVFFRN